MMTVGFVSVQSFLFLRNKKHRRFLTSCLYVSIYEYIIRTVRSDCWGMNDHLYNKHIRADNDDDVNESLQCTVICM